MPQRPSYVTCTLADGIARVRGEQAFLLAARNTRVAREAAFATLVPEFGPRQR